MEFKHACSFCGWGRMSATPVMLAPACEQCGCALDARAVEAVGGPVTAFRFPAAWARALQILWVMAGLLALYAATKLGYDAAGPSGALIAFGIGGFLLVPFVPQRLGAPRAPAADA